MDSGTDIPPVKRDRHIWLIIRDIVIVWVLTVMGGFIAGFASGPQPDEVRLLISIAVSNLLLGTLGFTIVGCLAPAKRWRHLSVVAFGSWLTGIINVLFFGSTVPQWIFGALFIALIMGLGGALSYLFKRH